MRPDRNRHHYTPIYPDVLRMIHTGSRANMDLLELLTGVFPRMAYINQPFEAVLILQNMTDAQLPVRISVVTPNADRDGNVVLIEMAKSQLSLTLKPAEVGALRIPMIAKPPTRAATNLPVRIKVNIKEPDKYAIIRPPGGGAPPSVLSVSPFKIQVFQDVTFVDQTRERTEAGVFTVNFDFAPKNFPDQLDLPSPSYEALWTQTEMSQDREAALAAYDEALDIALPGPLDSLFYAFFEEVTESFGNRDLPLHPAEAAAIAKMMVYTVEDAPAREALIIENSRWFRELCQLLAADPDLPQDLPRHEIISKFLFESVLHDSIMMAFYVLESHVQENLGSALEREQYAHKLITWFAGSGDADLTYAYMPLVLGGTAIGYSVARNWGDNPWYFYNQMIEAYNGRVRLHSEATEVIFDILRDLLQKYERRLRQQRIPYPD